MLFVGLTSSLVVRRGFSGDWTPISLPKILGWNAVILLVSSYAFEKARRALEADSFRIFQQWLWVTAVLGTGFLIGQWLAWRELAAQGVFLASNPSSSFFYVLTATHGTHLIGGIAALTYLTIRATRNEFGATRRSALKATAVYWHFMDALWVYLLFVLIFWR
jgi:cytochrome c oxidase subunit 3